MCTGRFIIICVSCQVLWKIHHCRYVMASALEYSSLLVCSVMCTVHHYVCVMPGALEGSSLCVCHVRCTGRFIIMSVSCRVHWKIHPYVRIMSGALEDSSLFAQFTLIVESFIYLLPHSFKQSSAMLHCSDRTPRANTRSKVSADNSKTRWFRHIYKRFESQGHRKK